MVFGITVARDITNLYQDLSQENKLKFFKKINEKYKANDSEVNEAIKKFKLNLKMKKIYLNYL